MKLYYPAALPASLFPASRQDFRLHVSAEQAGRHPLTTESSDNLLNILLV